MFGIEITFPSGQVQRCHSRDTSLVIGKGPGCKVVLSGWRVGHRHAELLACGDQVFVHDLQSASGTRVNGERINAAGPLSPDDVIVVAGHEIRVWWQAAPQGVQSAGQPRSNLSALPKAPPTLERHRAIDAEEAQEVRETQGLQCALASQALHSPGRSSLTERHEKADEAVLIGTLSTNAPLPLAGAEPLPESATDPGPVKQPLPASISAATPATVLMPPVIRAPAGAPESESCASAEFAALLRWRKLLHEQLVDAFGVRRTDVHRMADDELRTLTEALLRERIDRLPELPADLDRDELMAQVRDEAIGLGLLEPLLADPGITEIMVNAADEIFVERAGRLHRVPQAFTSNQAVLGIIERIVAPIGRRIDESSPLVDARLKDGSRVHAVIAPLALKGPCLTIRKFPQRALRADDLLANESASPQMMAFLEVCVAQRKNIVISGGTGSGKTTLLNILSNFIPPDERIVTIEDAAELQLGHANLVSMEARPANLEGKGLITIRELVRNALRMRPDRIVVGECRGGEALDMLQAMNTGHDGSLTTAHANTPRDMLSRLEVMVLMAGMELPVSAIREQIASAVHLIVQQSRLPGGARKITSIVEVTGIESGKIQLQEIFAHVRQGDPLGGTFSERFTGRGCVPEFYENLGECGVPLDLRLFAIQHPEDAAARRAA